VVTHQLQVERRTGKVRRPKTDVLTTEPCYQPTILYISSVAVESLEEVGNISADIESRAVHL